MATTVQWPQSSAFARKLFVARAVADGTAASWPRLRDDLKVIVQTDHVDKMLRGVDRYGKPRAPLAASTLRNKRRGPGPSLVPNFLASRYITTARATWNTAGGRSTLRLWFEGFVSPKGFPIPQAHEKGARSRNLPARPVMGITPSGWAKINRRFNEFSQSVFEDSP